MAGRRKSYTDAQIVEALRRAAGVQVVAAELLFRAHGRPCSRQQISHRILHSPGLQKALTDIRDQNIDLAESRLLEKIRGGNINAIVFYLSTQGKERGYSRRVEATGAGGGPMVHRHEGPPNFADMSEEEADAYLAARAAGPESS
jgi:hypothetical protein